VALGPSSNLYSQNYPFVVHAHVAQRGNCMVQYVVSSRGF
jgi:hypothetical protein